MTDIAAPFPQVLSSDREALASVIQAHRLQIKTRFRARFAAGAMRFYDSSDFFATVLRRADSLTSRLDAAASLDVRRLVREIMLEALCDCARTELQDRHLEQRLRETEPDRSDSPRAIEPDELCRLGLSEDEMDLARLHAGGLQHTKVALALGMSAAAVRMRWHRLIERFRDGRGGGRD